MPGMVAHRQPARFKWAHMLRYVKEAASVSLGSLR